MNLVDTGFCFIRQIRKIRLPGKPLPKALGKIHHEHFDTHRNNIGGQNDGSTF